MAAPLPPLLLALLALRLGLGLATEGPANATPDLMGGTLWPADAALWPQYSAPRPGDVLEDYVGNYPYLVSVWLSRRPLCTGSLLTTQWVLTAAGCLLYPRTAQPLPPRDLHVVAGLSDLRRPVDDDPCAQSLAVDETFYHPYLDLTTGAFDVALVRVEGSFQICGFSIRRAPVPNPEEIRLHATAERCAWPQWVNETIFRAAVWVQPPEHCPGLSSSFPIETLCANASCTTASWVGGGPLVCSGLLVAVAVWDPDLQSNGTALVKHSCARRWFTLLQGGVRDWLEQTMILKVWPQRTLDGEDWLPLDAPNRALTMLPQQTISTGCVVLLGVRIIRGIVSDAH